MTIIFTKATPTKNYVRETQIIKTKNVLKVLNITKSPSFICNYIITEWPLV